MDPLDFENWMEQSGTIIVPLLNQASSATMPDVGDHLPVIRRLTLTGSIFEGVALIVRVFPSEAQLWVQPPDCEHDPLPLPLSCTWQDLNCIRAFMVSFKQREATTGR